VNARWTIAPSVARPGREVLPEATEEAAAAVRSYFERNPRDELADVSDTVDVLVLADVDGSKALVVVDGPLLGAGLGAGLEDGLDRFADVLGALHGVDPCPVKLAIVVGGEAGDVDSWGR
jgi:hypothetical protein